MGDWTRRVVRTRYRFMRVDRKTGAETERIRALRGGSIERNDDVRIKESAEASLLGSFDAGPDLVRIWMDAEWADGSSESVPLGTFLPVVPSREVRGGYSKSSLKMYGRLQELLDDKFAAPVTVAKGSNAVSVARGVIEQSGLSVEADASGFVTTNTRYYGVGAEQNNSDYGDTKLDMVNDLLSLAGFRAAYTDPMGTVQLRRYADPADIPATWMFTEGPDAKFEGAMTEEFDYTNSANHVVVRYGGDDGSEVVVGEAYDTDPASPLSTVSRGRVITNSYSYNDLPPGATAAERQAYANQRAAVLLSTAQSVILRLNVTHAYAPVAVNDMVHLTFESGGIHDDFQVRTQTLRLAAGCPTEAELRKFRRRA